MADSSIGMMDEAYFVGRREILQWINETLQLNLAKIEQTANGCVAIQMLDLLHPGRVPVHKVKWNAQSEYEFIHNYKVLQAAFSRIGINRHIDVNRLIRAKYQDNLEFMQWFKGYFEQNKPEVIEYDPVARRRTGKGGSDFEARMTSESKATSGRTRTTTKARKPPASSSRAPNQENSNTTNRDAASNRTTTTRKPVRQTNSGTASGVSEEVRSQEMQKLVQENAELRLGMEGLEKERDFYFEKLREIEILLQSLEQEGSENALITQVFDILYATTDEFEEPQEGTTNTNASNSNNEEGGGEFPNPPAVVQEETF